MWVATVWNDGVPRKVMIPKDSTMAGRLMEDRATVTKGMPVVSARHAGYGIVAEIDSAMAYRISGTAASVQGQIKNGPGPFKCEPIGTIAALPAGTVPEPPPTQEPDPQTTGQPQAGPQPEAPSGGGEGSEPTGLRLVCTAPDDIKLINGAAVTLDMITGKAANALVLPVEAVAGTQGKGKVDVVGEDRTRKTVDVVLGLTDGKVVQIKKGLKGDETIAVPGPNLPAAPGRTRGPALRGGGMTALIELTGITKILKGQEQPRTILDGVDLSVHAGESVAIVGRSGSGKSTLLSVVGLFDRADEGQYLLDGQDISRLPERKAAKLRSSHFGFVFQRFFLLKHLTAAQNVSMALVNGQGWLPRRDRRARVMQALEEVGIAHLAKNRPARMSGGEQQRVAIARALVRRPEVLLADEPTGALDTETGTLVIEALLAATTRGCGLILVTHDRDHAARMGRTHDLVDGVLTERVPA